MLLSPYRTTVVSLSMPESPNSSSICSLDRMSLVSPSFSWLVQFQPTAPRMCPWGVRFGIDVDLDQPQVGVPEVLLDPLGCNDGLWMCYGFRHSYPP